MSTYTLVDSTGNTVRVGATITSTRTGSAARFDGFGPRRAGMLPWLTVTWLDKGDEGLHVAKQFGASVERSAGPCWNDTCISPDCDDENHADVTGYTWRQAEGESYCPRHRHNDTCHGYSAGTRDADGPDSYRYVGTFRELEPLGPTNDGENVAGDAQLSVSWHRRFAAQLGAGRWDVCDVDVFVVVDTNHADDGEVTPVIEMRIAHTLCGDPLDPFNTVTGTADVDSTTCAVSSSDELEEHARVLCASFDPARLTVPAWSGA